MNQDSLYAGILAMTLLIISGTASFATPTNQTQLSVTTDETEDLFDDAGIVIVKIGEGSNATIQHYTFTPQIVEINPGDSVTWSSPSEFSDIHTVTFFQHPSFAPPPILPFALGNSNSTSLDVVAPFIHGAPILLPTRDGTEAIVALNKHAWYPAVVDVNNHTTYLEGPDIQATLNSTVELLNSGIITPTPSGGADVANETETTGTGTQDESSQGVSSTNETSLMANATSTATDSLSTPESNDTQEDQGAPFPPIGSFTVTFQQPGTYPYMCAIHPWMRGEVIVRDSTLPQTQGLNQTEAQGLNQTEAQGLNQTEAQGVEEESSSANPIFG